MKYRIREQGNVTHTIIVSVLIVALLVALGFIFWQNFIQKSQPVVNTPASQSTKEQGIDDTNKEGTIVGSLTYPAEGIPKDLVVYAKNLNTNKEYSTSEHLSGAQYQYGMGYALNVPAGRYYVYGILKSRPDTKAYYNQVIVCGVKVECTDTTKVKVTVKPGEDTSDITVGDWWSV